MHKFKGDDEVDKENKFNTVDFTNIYHDWVQRRK